MRALILLSVLLLVAAPCIAQPTLSLWGDAGGTLVNDFDVPLATPFDVVVVLDSDGHDVSLVDWGMTNLQNVAPGLFKLDVSSPIGGCGVIPENCFEGHYTIYVNGCHPGGDQIEVVRVTFADFGGVLGPDIVATIGPNDWTLVPETSGFIDCGDAVIEALMGGSPGGTTSSGVSWPPGGMIFNPTRPLPVDSSGISLLKSRF